jgi:acetyl-CoA synthetase
MAECFGHRIGTAEVENAINMFSDVVESARSGLSSHDVKGQGIYALSFATMHLSTMKNLPVKISW